MKRVTVIKDGDFKRQQIKQSFKVCSSAERRKKTTEKRAHAPGAEDIAECAPRLKAEDIKRQ